MTTMYEIEQWARRMRVTFEVWHDGGPGADRRGEDAFFPLDPTSPISPAVPQRPRYGQQFRTLTKVYTGEANVPVDGSGASFLFRALTDPWSWEFADHTSNAAMREVSRAYDAVAPRRPRWGDVIVTITEHGRLAHLIHAVWPTTDDPDGAR